MNAADYILHLKYSNNISIDVNLKDYKDFEDNKTLTREMLPFFNDLTYVAIPRSVEKLGKSVFKGLKENVFLEFINGSVKEIGENAFEESEFTSFRIPSSVTVIKDNAFKNCANLSSMILPLNLNIIGANVFENTKLTDITLPESLLSIGNNAFYHIATLQDIYYNSMLPCKLGNNAFPISCNLNIPYGCTCIYKQQNNWENYSNYIENSQNTFIDKIGLSDGYTSYILGTESYEGIYLSDSVLDNLCDKCNYNKVDLKYIIIGAHFESISELLFDGLSNIKYINIADGITDISDNAFSKSGIIKIDLPSTLTTIGKNVFIGCKQLLSINLPEGITGIPSNTFSGCEQLRNISLPSTLTLIDTMAFRGCYNITSIVLPINLTTINLYAFDQCEKLTEVYNLSSIPITSHDSITTNGGIGYYATYIHTSMSEPSEIHTHNDYLYAELPFGPQDTKVFTIDYIGDSDSLDFSDVPTSCISRYAFYGNDNIKESIIPTNIEFIGDHSFFNCTNLKTVIMQNNTPCTLRTYAFKAKIDNDIQTIPGLKIKVPASAVNAYKEASGWSEYAGIIEAIQE